MHPSNRTRFVTKDAKQLALRGALRDRDPFCNGLCVVPDHQLSLYYRHDENQHLIDFSKAGEDELEKLYQACKPAPFGRGADTVVDEAYRKAGKMDTDTFSMPFDPRSLGIHDRIAKGLLTNKDSADVEMELYKLNVYGKDDFLKSHKDTPRSKDMVGSLVVVLPTKHEGGQLVLRHGGKEWSVDFSEKIAAAASRAPGQSSVYFVAFFGDIDHEVLPVTSGHRVTLTYNLYRKPSHPSTSYLPTPFTQKLRCALIDVVNDKSKLPNGGYLGFDLAHEYNYSEDQPVTVLMGQLKGSDRALADICDELGLKYDLRFFYRRRNESVGDFCLLTSRKLCCPPAYLDDPTDASLFDYIEVGLRMLTSDDAEGVVMAHMKLNREALIEDLPFMRKFYRDPVSEVLKITAMQSLLVGTPYMIFGNKASLGYLYGCACMIVSVDPAESRALLE